MVDLLDDPARARRLADAGEARARSFDWARSARLLADVYRELTTTTTTTDAAGASPAERGATP